MTKNGQNPKWYLNIPASDAPSGLYDVAIFFMVWSESGKEGTLWNMDIIHFTGVPSFPSKSSPGVVCNPSLACDELPPSENQRVC